MVQEFCHCWDKCPCDAIHKSLRDENAQLKEAIASLHELMKQQKGVPAEFERVFRENFKGLLA